MGQVTVAVEHTFEAAHRLPFLGGKCTNVHGHTWRARIHFQAYELPGGVDENGISVDFSSVKKVIRQWIDRHLDHGMMIGGNDNLLTALTDDGCKTFIFGEAPDGQEVDYLPKPWPTVESVAEAICLKLQDQFQGDLWIVAVELWEGNINSATFTQVVPYNQNAEIING
jgi:6-pyruvoyltetrahydropterin/6-carboxytetrahydropterin synthase